MDFNYNGCTIINGDVTLFSFDFEGVSYIISNTKEGDKNIRKMLDYKGLEISLNGKTLEEVKNFCDLGMAFCYHLDAMGV